MVQRIGNINGIAQTPRTAGPTSRPGLSFRDVLQKATSGITVSAHAQERIRNRHIPFGAPEMARMETAMNKAAAKGCQDSLVMLDSNAFVVSVRNRTVVTAMDGMNVRDNVFTKIDSAVIA